MNLCGNETAYEGQCFAAQSEEIWMLEQNRGGKRRQPGDTRLLFSQPGFLNIFHLEIPSQK